MALKVQTVIFPTNKFSVTQAKSWLKKHNFKVGKVHTTENYHRFRQISPNKIKDGSYRTKKVKGGIGLVFGECK